MHSRFVLGILAVMVAGLAIKYYEYNRKEPLPTTTTYAQHPSSPWGVHLLQGRRPYMEDTFSTLEENPALLFGVYDGHGGDVVSLYLAEHVLSAVNTKINEKWKSSSSRQKEIHDALFESFLETNEEFKSTLSDPNDSSGGSTAVVAAIYQDYENHYRMAVANTGDSRGILCCSTEKDIAVKMSEDHKPNNPSERARIEESGGFVSKRHRGPYRVNGVLATSRAFGDFYLAPQVIADPEIIDVALGVIGPDNLFQPNEVLDGTVLILASDGLWDVFSSNEAALLVQQLRQEGLSAQEISEELVELSYQKGSYDNITALVVFLDSLLHNLHTNQVYSKL